MKDKTDKIEQLIDKAADSESPDQAMKFAQAALNAANAMCSARSALSIPISNQQRTPSAAAGDVCMT